MVFVLDRNVCCLYTRVCVHARACVPATKDHPHDRITNQTSPTAFQFLCMTLAIDITDGQALVTKRVVSYCQTREGYPSISQ